MYRLLWLLRPQIHPHSTENNCGGMGEQENYNQSLYTVYDIIYHKCHSQIWIDIALILLFILSLHIPAHALVQPGIRRGEKGGGTTVPED